MLIHPELRALRDDDSPQRAAQDALYASLAVWRVRPEVAAVLAAIDRFASFAPLTECPALAALFRAGDPSARRLADSFSAATANALALSPLGHVPLRHNIDGKSSTLALARKGNVALMLVATTNEALAGATRKVGVSFGPSESWEHVLAGSAKGESIECCIAGSRTALLERRAIALSPGCVVALSGERRALRLREIEGCLVSLRLQRRQANAGASREYDLDTGELIHQAAGNPRDSRVELMMALLGRMGRTDAAPAMARIARGDGSPALRWQALRECLALDSSEGFAALVAVAAAPRDPLAGQAAQLRAQLLAAHPQLAELEPCPA
jgi:hypothetical protein